MAFSKKYKIFGEGGVQKKNSTEEFEKEFLGEIPINPEVREKMEMKESLLLKLILCC